MRRNKMEETKKEEQPNAEQADVLNLTEEKSADSCDGSSNIDTEEKPIGKFKSSEALLEAYNALQAEFTKKCQKLSELEKDKANEQSQEKQEERLREFLSQNQDALSCKDEFSAFAQNEQTNSDSLDGVWAKFVLSKLSTNNENYSSDPIAIKYIFRDENVRNKIIENYIKELNNSKPPVVMSKQSGQVVAEQKPVTPTSLKEAKHLVEEMFS